MPRSRSARATLTGAQIAENARCACLSFYPTKNLGALGDAGALVTRDEALAAKFRQTRQHGETTRYNHAFVGGNFRMDSIQAAALDVKLRYLDKWTRPARLPLRITPAASPAQP